MDNALKMLEEKRKAILASREKLRDNLVAHDGALQVVEELIANMSKDAGNLPAPIDESGEAGQRDATAEA
jgi:hypothetical protein